MTPQAIITPWIFRSFLLFFHKLFHVGNGIDRDLFRTFQVLFQGANRPQLLLPVLDVLLQRLGLLLQQEFQHLVGILALQDAFDGFQGKAHGFPQADALEFAQVLLGVQPPSPLAELGGREDPLAVVELDGAHGNPCKFGDFPGGVKRHRTHLLGISIAYDAGSQARGDAGS